jgi:hypothetical protein
MMQIEQEREQLSIGVDRQKVRTLNNKVETGKPQLVVFPLHSLKTSFKLPEGKPRLDGFDEHSLPPRLLRPCRGARGV